MKRCFFLFQINLIIFVTSDLIGQPTISEVAPLTGKIGTIVTIKGSNFDPIPSNNIVYFGATRAIVTASSSTDLSVMAPAGATYQPLTVLVNGLIGYYDKPFLLTFDGNMDSGYVFEHQDLPLPNGYGKRECLIGDLDGDGKSDLVCRNDSKGIRILQNTSKVGAIDLSLKQEIDFNLPTSVGIGDLNGDGKLDLVVVDSAYQGTISVLKNTSESGSISFATRVDIQAEKNPNKVSIGDIDGDGKSDLVYSTYIGNTISVLRNTTAEGAVDFASKVVFTTGTYPDEVAITDIDDDGKVDIIVLNQESLSVFRNRSSMGVISFDQRIDIPTKQYARSLSIGDMDRDGKVDVGFAEANYYLAFLRNLSSIGLINFEKIEVGVPFASPTLTIGDLDGDSKLDITGRSDDADSPFIFKNTSSVGLINFESVTRNTGLVFSFLSIGDIDGDGKPEMIDGFRIGRNVIRSNQNIVFDELPSKKFGDPPFSLSATTSSGLPLTYHSSNSSVATINESTVTIVGAGNATIVVTQAGDSNYVRAQAEQPLFVAKATQQIIFPTISDKTIGDSSFDLMASTSSNLIISYSASPAEKVAINMSQLTPLIPGRVTIKASQNGSVNYEPAMTVNQSFCINPAKPVVNVEGINSESPILTSNSTTGNQWFFNGIAMPNATNQIYTAEKSGVYKVQTKSDDCPSEFSEEISLVITGDIEEIEPPIDLYPNPGASEITIYLGNEGVKKEISFYNLAGKKVFTEKVYKKEYQFRVDDYPTGFYFVTILVGESLKMTKFLKK